MKRRRALCLSAICIIVMFTAAFTIASSEEAVVKDLICQRTDTLSGFYAGNIEKEDAVNKIKSIEMSHLMEEDIENIDLYFRTDIERVKKYSIKDLHITQSDEDIICADVEIEWQSEGLPGEENFTCSYKVICAKEENVYKLAQFFEGGV